MMRNDTKYPQTYLDRLLPNASCPNCTSRCVRREVARETNNGVYILVSHVCEDCDLAFSVRYPVQQLRTEQQKKKTATREETIKTKVKQADVKKTNAKKMIRLDNYSSKKKEKEEIPMDSKEKKKMLYQSVSKGFNTVSIVIFFTFIFMEAYEMYDFSVNNNVGSSYNMIVVFIVMVGLIVLTQLLSIIYKFLGR